MRRGRVTVDDAERPCIDGRPLEADLVVASIGPWLGELFRRSVRPISKVVRQDVIYTSPPDADSAYDADRLPCWVDHGYGAYGTPSVEGCGVKAAIAWKETVIDLDDDERVVEASAFHRTRQYLRHRLPGLARQRAVDQKACQIAMTPDTHFIVDFHPEHRNVLLVGGWFGAPLQAWSGLRRVRGRSGTAGVGRRGPLPSRQAPWPRARGISLGPLSRQPATATAPCRFHHDGVVVAHRALPTRLPAGNMDEEKGTRCPFPTFDCYRNLGDVARWGAIPSSADPG